MILQKGKNNRLLIYFFYDKAGVVDDYIVYMLQKMKPNVKDIIFVSNGKMTEDSVKKVEPLVNHIIQRKNEGMDVMAYKAAIDYAGYEKIREYDELIMMNFTIMGPVTSLEEMFETMDAKDVDYWGLTLFHGCDGDPFGSNCEYGYLPMHIQSHFITVRKSLLNTDDFVDYWESRPEIKYYSEAIGKHEAVFTKHFADKGYKWDVYSDTRDCMDYTDLPIISMPVKLIRDKKCPIFKRRNFFQEYFDIMNKSTGEIERELYEYLINNTDYDVNLIWDNMLRVQNIADIKKAVQLNYVLSSKALENNELKLNKVLFIVFVSDLRHMYPNMEYLKNIPKEADICVFAASKEIEDAFNKYYNPDNRAKVIVNRGIEDVVTRIGLAKNEIGDYEYVCFLNDFRAKMLEFDSVNESFLYRCYSSLVINDTFVKNVINKFENNERLGVMVPPPPNHADYFPTLGCFDWGDNFDETKDIAKLLNLKVDINRNKEPVAAYGHMFFARTDAIRKIFDEKILEYKTGDNSELAFERIYAFVAQDAGYYTASLMSDSFAEIETTNLQYMMTEVNKQGFALFGIQSHFEYVNKMREFLDVYGDCDPSSIEVRITRIIRRIIPRKMMGKIVRKIISLFRGNQERN